MRKGLIRSPYVPVRKSTPVAPQNFTGYVISEEGVMDLIRKLSSIHDEFTGKVGHADSMLQHLEQHYERMHQEAERLTEVREGIRLAKGEKGDPGDPGTHGRNGIDVDEEKIFARLSKLIKKPKNGLTPIVDYEKLARMVRIQSMGDEKGTVVDYDKILELMKEKLTIDHIPGVRAEIDGYRNQLAGKVYGKDTDVRGGGDTVKAGSGVTITQNADGQKVISASGAAPLIPVGAVNGVNQSYTVVARPSSVIADGITYYEDHGYTYSALQITMDSPPSQYIRYYA